MEQPTFDGHTNPLRYTLTLTPHEDGNIAIHVEATDLWSDEVMVSRGRVGQTPPRALSYLLQAWSEFSGQLNPYP